MVRKEQFSSVPVPIVFHLTWTTAKITLGRITFGCYHSLDLKYLFRLSSVSWRICFIITCLFCLYTTNPPVDVRRTFWPRRLLSTVYKIVQSLWTKLYTVDKGLHGRNVLHQLLLILLRICSRSVCPTPISSQSVDVHSFHLFQLMCHLLQLIYHLVQVRKLLYQLFHSTHQSQPFWPNLKCQLSHVNLYQLLLQLLAYRHLGAPFKELHFLRQYLRKAYYQIVHWKSNFFMVPSGQQSKRFTNEQTRLFQAFNQQSAIESISIKAAMCTPPLLIQKPGFKFKAKDHTVWWYNPIL